MTDRLRLRRAIDAATSVLAEAGIESARIDAELLAAHLNGTERGKLPVIDPPGPDFFVRYDEVVSARAQRIPLQHITGKAAFGPLQLDVGPGVFIPRPETEALLEWAVDQHFSDPEVVVDLCSGSGALAIALARRWPQARVIGIERDAVALRYARRNAESASREAQSAAVDWIEADVTTPGLQPTLTGRVDLVVSNPPYIPEGAQLEPEVALHDPYEALFGGPDGMSVIGPIVLLGVAWLKPGGRLAIEHDDTTSAQTVDLIEKTQQFTDVTPHRDLTGRPRFVTATKARG